MKKRLISLVSICVFILLMFNYFRYSTYYPNNEEIQKINEEYSLHLPNVEWQYTKYEKNFLFNKKTMIVLTNHYECKLLKNCDIAISISVTKEDSFVNLKLPFVPNSYTSMIKKSKTLHGNEVNVEVVTLNQGDVAGLKNDQYIPIYWITLENNGILYKFEFDTNDDSCVEDIYNVSESNVHEDILKIYFEFINEILFNES